MSETRRGPGDAPVPRDAPPPFGKRWITLEAAVLLALGACIALLAWLTVRFR